MKPVFGGLKTRPKFFKFGLRTFKIEQKDQGLELGFQNKNLELGFQNKNLELGFPNKGFQTRV